MAEEAAIEKNGTVFKKLRIFNGVVSAILLLEGILMLILSNDSTLPVTTNYLTSDPVVMNEPSLPRVVGNLRLGPLVAAFLLLSGLALLLLTLPRINEWYVRNLKKGANYARWMEYAITSSLMLVVIAMLSGMFDLNSLILLFFLNMMMILFGWMMELHNQTTQKTNWTAFYFGCLAGIVPWVVIALYFFSAVAEAQCAGAHLRLFHPPHPLRVLQHLRHQHGAAVQEGGEVERLPLRREGLYHPQPAGQVGAGLAGLRRHPAQLLRKDQLTR